MQQILKKHLALGLKYTYVSVICIIQFQFTSPQFTIC